MLEGLGQRFVTIYQDGREYRWYPLSLVQLPSDPGLDDWIAVDVRFPPGAHQGTPIDRARLSELRTHSGGAYRSLIATSALSWQPGRTRVLKGDKWEWSSDPARYPLLTRQDRSEIVFGAESKTTHTRAEVDGPFEHLEQTGDIIIADRDALDPNSYSQGWRILPQAAAP